VDGKRACVIGAGFGGLALAIRLQSAGVATTLVEARDKPGGCAYVWHQDGFTFDAGPTTIVDPGALYELWDLTGHNMAEDVELLPVLPFCRFSWPDGTGFDYSNDTAAMHREIARLDPADIAGYDAFLAYAATAHREGYLKVATMPFLGLRDMAAAVPAFARHRAWRSAYDTVGRFVRNGKLREALSAQTLLMGGNPMTASGIYALTHQLEQEGGVWCARGGTNRLAAAMLRHFERLGGTTRLHDPVVRVDTVGIRATEVATQSGWTGAFDAIASNADIVHTYRDLLGGTLRGGTMARRLVRKRFSPSVFAVHFGIEGSWPGIPHNMILFGPRYEGLLTDIFEHGVLPSDFAIYLHHPSVTDPSLAPEGKSTFTAMIPVANQGKLTIDWNQVGQLLEKRVLDEIGRRLIPDIHDRIVTKFHYAPRDFALDLNAHLGSAFSLEPILTQSAWFRGHNRDDVIANFYLVGAGIHPGAGIPAVIAGAKTTAGLMLEDLAA
jgi:phytoene desaturase